MAVERNPFDKVIPDQLNIIIDSSPSEDVNEDGETSSMEFDPEDGSITVEFTPAEDGLSKVQKEEDDEDFDIFAKSEKKEIEHPLRPNDISVSTIDQSVMMQSV